MSKSRGGPRTQRQSRVGEVLRHALAEVLMRGEIRDPAVDGVSITITEVDVGPDLKNATAYVMPLGGRDVEKVAEGLNRCARYLRGQIGHIVEMRYVPQLRFAVDHTFEQAAKIDELLRQPKVARDLGHSSDDE
ncbi:30S ribosome-binding factor RbfA [Emcibacter sp. SYSU 3D8]|uniref:30S ribosome-binding factor RbfA n=1 Tax=Emcibacter sp. SYSU 3D8 TaxID=3133969 RepID=UPI0031FEAA3C